MGTLLQGYQLCAATEGKSQNAIAITDLEGNQTYVNPSFLKLWGYDDENEVLGRHASEFSQMTEDVTTSMEALFKEVGRIGESVGKVKEHVLTTDNLTKLVHMINEEMDGLATDYSERLHIITVETADVDYRLERLYDAFETGQIQLADLAPWIQQLRHRHDKLQAPRLELEQQLSDRRVELADEKTVS